MRSEKILMIGDSLIDYGAWPLRLPGRNVISRGIPGERSEELLQRIDAEVSAAEAEIIIIMTGTNNLLWGDVTFPETVTRIICRIRSLAPDTGIVITSLLPFRIPGIETAVVRANQLLKTIAAQQSCWYCDLFEEFARTPANLFEPDGVHINEEGYRVWSTVILEQLEQWLIRPQ